MEDNAVVTEKYAEGIAINVSFGEQLAAKGSQTSKSKEHALAPIDDQIA